MNSVDEKKSVVYYSEEGDNNGMEMDQESNGSSSTEDFESPRSVAVKKLQRRSFTKVHARNDQVSRIKTEDSRVGEDIGERNLCLKDRSYFVLYSRPVLPASPLRGKTIQD